MGGTDPGEAVPVEKTNYPAIPFTAQRIDAARIGDFGLSGTAVLWASKMGICLGGGGGSSKTWPRITTGSLETPFTAIQSSVG